MHKKPGRCGKSGDWPFLKRKLTRKHPSPPSTTYHNTKSEALQSTSAAAPPQFCNTLPQAIRCLATSGMIAPPTPRPVSIARRRFVVLRRLLRCHGRSQVSGFNRPQAIRCLATPPQPKVRFFAEVFQSPAGDSLSCDTQTPTPTLVPAVCFNRPQAIRCLATGVHHRHHERFCKFQSPAGDSLSCDPPRPPSPVDIPCVSIARRRFVVLRLSLAPLPS